jgi:hypothetical protein
MNTDKQKEKLKQMLEEEREKVKGYEEVVKLHSAYISILLHRMKATEDNSVVITKEDVKQAMSHFEARAIPKSEGVWAFYCEEVKK